MPNPNNTNALSWRALLIRAALVAPIAAAAGSAAMETDEGHVMWDAALHFYEQAKHAAEVHAKTLHGVVVDFYTSVMECSSRPQESWAGTPHAYAWKKAPGGSQA